MRKIKLFITSAEELTMDKSVIGNLVRQINIANRPLGFEVEMMDSEDFDISECESCDLFVALFHREADKVSFDGIEKATESFASHNLPKVFIYFKDLSEGEFLDDELERFKDHICTELGHFVNRYRSDDSIKFSVVMQIMKVNGTAKTEIKGSCVMLHDEVIADLNNLPFAGNNPAYQTIQSRISNLEKEISSFEMVLSSMPNETIESMLRQKRVERAKLKEEYEELGKSLLDTAIQISGLYGRSSSARLSKAIELFENGDSKGANAILDFDEIGKEMEHNALLIDKARALERDSITVLRSNIDECRLKIRTVRNEKEPGWLKECLSIFEKVLSITKGRIEDEHISLMLEYLDFLEENNQLDKGEALCKEIERLVEQSCPADEGTLAHVELVHGSLNFKLHRYPQAEKYLESSLSHYRNLAEVNPDQYRTDVLKLMNRIAVLHHDTKKFLKAEKEYSDIIAKYKALSEGKNIYVGEIAVNLADLAELHHTLGDTNSSEREFSEAIQLFSLLEDKEKEKSTPAFAHALANYGNLLADICNFDEAGEKLQSSANLIRNLAKNSPDAYDPELASVLIVLADVCSNRLQFNEAETNYQEALKINRSLAALYPEAYNPILARSLSAISTFHGWQSKYQLAIEESNEAVEMYKSLSEISPEAFESAYANALGELSILYKETEQYSSAISIGEMSLSLTQKLAMNFTEPYQENVAWTMDSLAHCLEQVNDIERSGFYHTEAVKIMREFVSSRKDYQYKLAQILHSSGSFHWGQEDYDAAEKELTESMDIIRSYSSIHKEFEPLLADYLGDIATLHSDLQRKKEAVQEFEESLGILRIQASISPEMSLPRLAIALNNCAHTYEEVGESTKAEKYYSESVEITRQFAELSPEAYMPTLAQYLGNLAVLHKSHKNYLKAEEEFVESLAIYEKLQQGNEKDYADDLARTHGNLANLYNAQDRTEEAECEYNKAIDLYLPLFNRLPDTYVSSLALNYGNIGSLHFTMGKYSCAEEEYQKSINLYLTIKGSAQMVYRPALARTYANLAKLYIKIGDKDKALENYLRTCELFINLPKESIPVYGGEFVRHIDKLAGILFERKDYTGAAEWYSHALKTFEELSKNSPESYLESIANDTSNLALCYKNLNKYEKSEQEYYKAIEYYSAMDLKMDLLKNAQIHCNLGYVLLRQNKLKEARKQYSDALNLYRILAEEDGRYFGQVAFTQIELVKVLHAQGELNAAEPIIHEALGWYSKQDDSRYDMAKSILYNYLSYIEFTKGNFAECLSDIETALSFSSDNPALLDSKGEFLAKMGRFDEALAIWARIIELAPDFTCKVDSTLFKILKDKGLIN